MTADDKTLTPPLMDVKKQISKTEQKLLNNWDKHFSCCMNGKKELLSPWKNWNWDGQGTHEIEIGQRTRSWYWNGWNRESERLHCGWKVVVIKWQWRKKRRIHVLKPTKNCIDRHQSWQIRLIDKSWQQSRLLKISVF